MRPAALTLAAALMAPVVGPSPALAEGGDRMPAGGAFMSSDNWNPYAPRGPGTPYSAGGFGTPDVSFTATVPFERPAHRARLRRR